MADHDPVSDPGGDPVCWLDRVCDECGGLGGHRAGCASAQERAAPGESIGS